MPGINQLKKFIENISSIGDEQNVRAQRGELYIPYSLPTGLKDVEDADDFLYGFSGTNSDDQIESFGDINPEDMNPDDLNLDYLLSGEDKDKTNDLQDDFSLEEEIPSESSSLDSAFSLPEEDINLDALNDFMEDSEVPSSSPDIPDVEIPDTITPLESFEIPQEENFSMGESSDPLSAFGDLNSFESEDENEDFSSQMSDDLANSFASNFDEEQTAPNLDDFGELEEIGELEELEPIEDEYSEPVQDMSIEEVAFDDFSEPSSQESAASETSSGPDFSDLGFEVEDFEPQQPVSSSSSNTSKSSSETIDFDGITVDEFTPSQPIEKKTSSSDGMSFGADDFSLDDIPEVDFSSSESSSVPASSSSDFGSDFGDIEFTDIGSSDIGMSDLLSEIDGPAKNNSDNSLDSLDDFASISDIGNFGNIDSGNDFSSSDELDSLPIDSLDDFSTTDEAIANNSSNEFEIPGFSSSSDDFDFDYSEPQDLNNSSFDSSVEKRTSLTDEEYKIFKKNLHDYPLNLRIEIEKLIVNNEFKDDAVFAVIEKVINGAAARQVSAHLSKYLDISVDVPRDYERRTAEQYDSYKKSLEYQLKNRILPLCVVSIFAVFVVIGMFFLIERFVYRPVMADMLYKEGYELLENNLFPQSEVTFNRAVNFKPKKKWFLKYARGYCQKKQYDRSRRMYENSLLRFNHDKLSGMEYAQMELYELYNYERAEEIIKREILDYHINDPDALLLLGDVYLEWATEKNPDKFEDAFVQYTDLINLFGNNDEYTKRLMRYYIRTDNLREVLPIKAYFYGLKKNVLGSSDLTELSGYLLEKLYGPLSPSDEYLRSQIENVRQLLEMAIESDPTVPEPHYNLAKYFVNTGNEANAQLLLNTAITQFENSKTRKPKRIQKNIDCFRLLGEIYTNQQQYLLAEETYGKGIMLFEEEQKNSFLKATPEIGKLYADLGDLDYFISGNIDNALLNFTKAVKNEYDNASVNYKIGFIHYANKDYEKSLNAFIKSAQEKSEDKHLLFSLGNVLALRNDDYSAQGYYERLIDKLDLERARAGILMPQIQSSDGELVDLYMKTSNNLGVVLNRLAKRTGDSSLNAQAMVNLSESLRAWDALTRNQTTMVRLEGSNLAAQNLKYISHPYSDFEPSIYISIPRVLDGEHILEQTFIK
ncbi:MAG: tetratricopeptide repeat protein [Spirochaetaceae bacterium]|nr:tetratricopeptide repeat protein [Spirochaetaceae bacterium]